MEQELAFVVDGWALEIILSRYNEAFTELAVLSKTAICCRVTPSQKAQVNSVALVCSCLLEPNIFISHYSLHSKI